jgi:RNA polymerase sigma factor (sigma-70 family)
MVPVPEPDLHLPLAAGAPTADLVARHAAFVRALARRLCRSEADADDLAQDTWVEVLRRPAEAWVAPEDRPDGWLARVAQRLAGRHARAERRRGDREVRAARDMRDARVQGLGVHAHVQTRGAQAHDPSTRRAGDAVLDTSLEHALVLRDVADALVALDGDARRIVVARHFEGLELAALAAREGVATSTLKLRLAAAYERLRGRLDEHAGGDRTRWTRALSAATGGGTVVPVPILPDTRVQAPTPTSAKPEAAPLGAAAEALRAILAPLVAHLSPLSVVAMGLTLKLTAVAALGALVATGLALREDERNVEALAPRLEDTLLATTEHAALDAAAMPSERTATPTAAEVLSAEQPPLDARELSASATVEVLVTDLDGVPAPGVEVLAAPWNGPLNRVGTTNARGAYTLRWRPGFGDSRLLVALRARGVFLGGLRVLEAHAGGRSALRAAIDPALLERGTGGTFKVRLVMAAHGLQNTSGDVAKITEGVLELALVSSELEVGRSDAEASGEVERELRRGPLEAEAEQLGDGEVAFVSAGAALEVVETSQRTFSTTLRGTTSPVSFDLVAESVLGGPTAVVRGVVRDLSGLPAASARVSAHALDVEGSSPVMVITDREGRFELRAPLGRTRVVAGTGPNPGSRAEVVLIEGDERTCDLTLDRGLALVGAAVSGEAPLVGAHVEATLTSGDERWLAIVVTDAEGRFVIPHCAAPSVDLDLFAPESGVPVPLATYEGVGADLEPFMAKLDPATAERLVVSMHDGEPGAVAVGELRVHDDRCARVARIPVRGEVGTPIDVQLPPGFWWLSASSHGPHHGAPQRIELRRTPPDAPLTSPAEQALDVGPTAALALPAPPEGATWRVERLVPGRAPSAVAVSLTGMLAEDLEVPAGTYRVLALGAEGVVLRSSVFELKAGERAALPTAGD